MKSNITGRKKARGRSPPKKRGKKGIFEGGMDPSRKGSRKIRQPNRLLFRKRAGWFARKGKKEFIAKNPNQTEKAPPYKKTR